MTDKITRDTPHQTSTRPIRYLPAVPLPPLLHRARWTVLVVGQTNKQTHADTHVNMDTKYQRYNSEAQLDYVSDFRWVGASFSLAGGKRTTFTMQSSYHSAYRVACCELESAYLHYYHWSLGYFSLQNREENHELRVIRDEIEMWGSQILKPAPPSWTHVSCLLRQRSSWKL